MAEPSKKREYYPSVQVQPETYDKLKELAEKCPHQEVGLGGEVRSPLIRPGVPLTVMLRLIVDYVYDRQDEI